MNKNQFLIMDQSIPHCYLGMVGRRRNRVTGTVASGQIKAPGALHCFDFAKFQRQIGAAAAEQTVSP